jgi:hypothetical protein
MDSLNSLSLSNSYLVPFEEPSIALQDDGSLIQIDLHLNNHAMCSHDDAHQKKLKTYIERSTATLFADNPYIILPKDSHAQFTT